MQHHLEPTDSNSYRHPEGTYEGETHFATLVRELWVVLYI